MGYKQYPVHPTLKNWVRYFWSYDSYTPTVQALHIRSFADRYPRLIFQDIRNSSPIKDAWGNEKPICYLSGIDTAPSNAFWDSRFSHFGVSFEPHALHTIFGIDATALTNQMPDIQLLEKKELSTILINAKTHERRIKLLSSYFYEKITIAKQDTIINDLILGNWTDKLDNENKIASIAKHYHISERQIQRRFKMHVGVSARKFSRIVKFENSLQALSNARYGNLVQLAYSLDYSDQSHFINDFKLFSGLSPYDFVKGNSLGSESSSFIYPE